MKAYSFELEVFVRLNEEELFKLKDGRLSGAINFRGTGERAGMQRNIPFELKYSENQKRFLEARLSPRESYFGESEIVRFSINNLFYRQLENRGKFGDRFFTGGKLTIEVI